MKFEELFYHHFMQGVPIRRKGWVGYWIRKDFSTIECHKPAQNKVTLITERDDIVWVIENILKGDWEIAEDIWQNMN